MPVLPTIFQPWLVGAAGAYNATDAVYINFSLNGEGWPLPNSKLAILYGLWQAQRGGTIVATVIGLAPITGSTGNVYAEHKILYGGVGETYYAHAYDPGFAVATIGAVGVQTRLHSAQIAVAAGDILHFLYTRDATHGSDTLECELQVVGFLMEWL